MAVGCWTKRQKDAETQSPTLGLSVFQTLRLSVFYHQSDLLPSAYGLADAFGKGTEGLEGVLEAAGHDAGAEDDAAVGAAMNSVAGLEHGAEEWHGGVDAYVLLPLAAVACRFRV